MKKVLFISLLIFSASTVFAQTKIISNTSLGAGLSFAASMDQATSTITITLQGPSDRYLACGFGISMSDADPFIYTTGKTGVNDPEAVYDYRLTSQSAANVTKDAGQNWTTVSNTVNGATRTLVVSRPLNTGDGTDKILNFSDVSINIIWAKASTASMVLSYHGNGNRGFTNLVWQTVDLTAPALVALPFSPADNQTGVQVSSLLSADFNENIVAGSGLIELRLSGTGDLVESFDVNTADVSIAGAGITLNVSSNLLASTEYYVTIPNGAIEDAAGNAFAGFTDNTTWNFTTAASTIGIDENEIPYLIQVDNNQILRVQNISGLNFDLNIYSLTGQLLISKTNQIGELNVELSSINDAVLMLQFRNSNGTVSTKKINIR
jgi:hypothetical protein